MIVTEEQAKDRWCPMTRVPMLETKGMPAQPVANRNGEGRGMGFCLASSCMMWRESKGFDPNTKGLDLIVIGGYCGLAGRPGGEK